MDSEDEMPELLEEPPDVITPLSPPVIWKNVGQDDDVSKGCKEMQDWEIVQGIQPISSPGDLSGMVVMRYRHDSEIEVKVWKTGKKALVHFRSTRI
jgi:hypothetical protein